ncbi:MAG TPA: hypothetical protein VE665_00835 [Hyphomicrobiaceae bacterium]|nr:hypothetical protein [Hyphomicrobiaceae bacterium]
MNQVRCPSAGAGPSGLLWPQAAVKAFDVSVALAQLLDLTSDDCSDCLPGLIWLGSEHRGCTHGALKLETPDSAPSRPRGIVITPDGRYAAITGAPRGKPGSGVLFVVDVPVRKVVGRVTDVGSETYLLALQPAAK